MSRGAGLRAAFVAWEQGLRAEKRARGMKLRTPCKHCPFAKRPGRIRFLGALRSREMVDSAYLHGFPCHLSAKLDEEEGGYHFGPGTQNCAGAIGLFLNERRRAWPGLGERAPEGDWSKAQEAAFGSTEEFIHANEEEE